MKAAFACCALFFAACNSGKTTTVIGCAQDSDCGDPAHFSCEAQTGVCHCRDDGACTQGQFCNPVGFCQVRVTCYTNVDCDTGQICDANSNVCIPAGRCTSDDQCELGKLCDHGTGTCQPGCHSYGDCPTANACLCGLSDGGRGECSCDSVDPNVRAECAVGSCSTDACPNTSACAFGLICESDGGGLPQCASDYDHSTRPYCDACTGNPGTPSCGTVPAPNFCLLDTSNAGFGSSYCGVDCSQGQDCPNGFHCADVVVVRNVGCSQDSDCPPNATPCSQDTDCPNAGVCQKEPGQSTGFCAGVCYKHEGDTNGFCSCTIDSECDQDVCQSSTRTCSITQQPCNPNDAQPCKTIRCVPFHGLGGCFIGQNCAPDEGLSCSQVRPPS
jgi:hypothetical protein